KAAFPDAGWRIRSRDNAAPALSRNIERFSDFLTLVGLTALIVGGVGVANAVRAFLETKRSVIATFKSLGAPGNLIFLTYLFQILIISVAGIFIGMAIGALMPFLAVWALQGVLPVPSSNEIQWGPLGLGAVYGFLTAMAFAVWPLGVAREIPATDLFRGQTEAGSSRLPRTAYLILLGACVLALVALAIYLSENRFIAIVFIGAIVFAFVMLRAVAVGIQFLAKRAPNFRSTELRMAVGNIHRPGSLTPSVVLSLGLGLALLVALALIDGNLRQQVSGNLPERAPDFFFVDIQNTEKEPFEALLKANVPDGKIFSVPMLRGRITSLKGIPSEEYAMGSEGRWVLRGDRGITYATNIPENSVLSDGKWWPDNYSGKPLVSFSEEEAGELGLSVGDEITVNVLGRNISAEIASLRAVQWESLAINFVMVFSPNTFAGAPHSHLATLTLEDKGQIAELDARDGGIIRAVAKEYPAVTSVRVREALDMVNTLIGQLATAIRAAASVALVSSILVLGGALAAGNRARVHDAVVLKTLGATRWRLVRSFVYEYAILGTATAIFALLAGGIAAWFVISQIMEFPYIFQPNVAIITILVALVMTVGFGLVGTWRILGQKAAPVLREL
ncbi:MAG: FtsX-like permease family protein, partial [Salaquimonas sp.]